MKRFIQSQNKSDVPAMKRIGVIGGMGQWSTQDVINRILKVCVDQIPQYVNSGYPSFDLRMLNCFPIILNDDGTLPEILEPHPKLIEAAAFVGLHSDFIIVPSNTPHLFIRQIEEAAGKPLLSIVDVTVAEVQKRKYKRVGLLAIGLTLSERLFQTALEKIDVESVILREDISTNMDEEGVWKIMEGAVSTNVNKSTHRAVTYLREQDVDGIILGCTEVPILLGDSADEVDIINPSQLLAEAVVEKALT